MKLNWNFLGGGRAQNKKPSVGGVWIFSGTAYSISHGIVNTIHTLHGMFLQSSVYCNLVFDEH